MAKVAPLLCATRVAFAIRTSFGSCGLAQTASHREQFLDDRFIRTNVEFSPDGKWIACQSNQNRNQFDIYVAPFPGHGPTIPISTGGGDQPRWNGNGCELFYRAGNKIMAVDVSPGDRFQVATPHVVFEGAAEGYDVDPNGRRLLRRRAPLPE